jgi:hypothetical protein
MASLLFLDFDDVICLNKPYGGYDVAAPDKPADLYERLWHAPALSLLRDVIQEHQPQVVLTTSWLRFLLLDDARALFAANRSGMACTSHTPGG